MNESFRSGRSDSINYSGLEVIRALLWEDYWERMIKLVLYDSSHNSLLIRNCCARGRVNEILRPAGQNSASESFKLGLPPLSSF